MEMRKPHTSAAGVTVADSGNSIPLEIRPSAAEIRRSARVSMRAPGVLSWREGEIERVEAILTISISRFGCALHSRTFFQPGTRVRLDFGERTIAGRVVHSLKDHSTNTVTIGVAFDKDGREFWQLGFELGSRSF
jgi:hypothetical protein